MNLIYGRALQALAIAILVVIFIRIPLGWTPWLILPATLFFIGHHLVKFHKVLLHMAARAGNVEAIDELLRAGFPINLKRDNGFTPLHWAVVKQHREAVQYLLRNGASPTIRDNFRRTPLSYAEELGDAEIIKLLVDSGAQ